MDIENLRRTSDESRLRFEQQARAAAAQKAQEEADKKRQWQADQPKRIAEVEQEIRRNIQRAANEGKRECLLSHEDHYPLWKRGFFGRHNLNFQPSWKEKVIIAFCSREGLCVDLAYYGDHSGWGQNNKQKSGAVSVTARW